MNGVDAVSAPAAVAVCEQTLGLTWIRLEAALLPTQLTAPFKLLTSGSVAKKPLVNLIIFFRVGGPPELQGAGRPESDIDLLIVNVRVRVRMQVCVEVCVCVFALMVSTWMSLLCDGRVCGGGREAYDFCLCCSTFIAQKHKPIHTHTHTCSITVAEQLL